MIRSADGRQPKATPPLRVLFLTQYYPPETGAPQARISEMASHLAGSGLQVQILTAMPNYPKGEIDPEYVGKWVATEHLNGIEVHRTPIFATKSTGLVPRLTNYLSFVVSSSVLGPLLAHGFDVIVVESPPLFLGLSGVALKALFRAKMIFNVSDLWPESAVRMGMHANPAFVWLADRLERFCYWASDAQTGQSPGIVRGIKEKSCRPVTHIPNGCDCDRFRPSRRADGRFREEQELSEQTLVGYAGLLGVAQGMRIMVEVADRLRHRGDLRFVLVGDGPERAAIEAEAHRRRLENLSITGLMPREQLPNVVASFDIAFIPLRFEIPGALPSKVYEAMASAVPVVLAATGDPKDLVVNARAGLVVSYGEPDDIAAAILRLSDDRELAAELGLNGRRYMLEHHQRGAIAGKMAGFITEVAGRGWHHGSRVGEPGS